jgi:hypothetical protein
VALAKHPLVAQYDLSSLVELTSGAAPLSAELAQAVMARLGCRPDRNQPDHPLLQSRPGQQR